MTSYMLIDAVAREIAPLLPRFQVFSQFIPPRKRDDEPFQDYALVSLGNGVQEEEASQQVVITFGIEDREGDYQGYLEIVNAIERVKQHLLSKRVVDGRYELKLPVQWVFPEDESYPCYFGGLLLTFILPGLTYQNEYM